MTKPTVHDIAREAGVSLATVDRVLNARPGVRQKTMDRVQDAVARLGYVRDTFAANLARQRQYRFAFVLPAGPNPFIDMLHLAIDEARTAQIADRISMHCLAAHPHDPHGLAQTLSGLTADRVDGLVIMAPETPQVRDAVARLKRSGVAVVTLVSDLPNSDRDHFVGVDPLSAGRTAATLMGRFVGQRDGTVLVVTNSMLARDSIERRLGFDSVIQSRFPDLTVAPSLEAHDSPTRLKDIVRRAIQTQPNLLGIYAMGTGDASLFEVLDETCQPDDLVVIAHELTPVTRVALQSGMADAVITQHAGDLIRSALRVLRAKTDGSEIFAAQEQIRIDIVLAENLPNTA